jgi:hypothetical protein
LKNIKYLLEAGKPKHFASTIKNRTSPRTAIIFNRACKASSSEFQNFHPRFKEKIKTLQHTSNTNKKGK